MGSGNFTPPESTHCEREGFRLRMKALDLGTHPSTSCRPPSMSKVAPVTAVFVMRWTASAAMSAGQLGEEPPEPLEVGGVEGRDAAGPELLADAAQALRVARGEDHCGALLARAPGRLEPDARAAADHDHGLPAQPVHSPSFNTCASVLPYG
jgi:hypothetical protein